MVRSFKKKANMSGSQINKLDSLTVIANPEESKELSFQVGSDALPLIRVIDLNLGESLTVEWSDDRMAIINLLDIEEKRDTIRHAVRSARVKVAVNGHQTWLPVANYHLPYTISNIRIDCPVTKGYLQPQPSFDFCQYICRRLLSFYNLLRKPQSVALYLKACWKGIRSIHRPTPYPNLPSHKSLRMNLWGLIKDARFRLWPAGLPLLIPDSFVYPVRQRWFASDTQMENEPTFVDGCEHPYMSPINYHCASDIGGVEGEEVLSATDGWIISAGNEIATEYKYSNISPRYDLVYIIDQRGWHYRYAHLMDIDPTIKVGRRIRKGQRLGHLGKEGASGGWAHLHFEILSLQPSGQWGIHNSYPFLWEAYQAKYAPAIVAVARPHQLVWIGQTLTLDGTRSISRSAPITHYQWTLTDGTTVEGATVERIYTKPGTYSEILQVKDSKGNLSYDFAIVQVLDPAYPDRLPPTIHAAYSPTLGIKPGESISFAVRTFRTNRVGETWDFGDESPPVMVQSDGNRNFLAPNGYAITRHCYHEPGDYIVRVTHIGPYGFPAIAHLYVCIDPL